MLLSILLSFSNQAVDGISARAADEKQNKHGKIKYGKFFFGKGLSGMDAKDGNAHDKYHGKQRKPVEKSEHDGQ